MKFLVALTSIIGFLMVVLAGPLYQFAGMELSMSFTLLRYGVYIGGAALVLILLQVLFVRKNIRWGATFVYAILALITIGMPLSMMNKVKSVPPIHDITTDVNNPPMFDAIIELRKDAPNPVAYEGGEITKQQLDAYPDLKTQVFAASISELYPHALSTVKDLGWEIAASNTENHTIEATDTTLWFGFKDDVVIRLTTQGEKTLVDVRSKSRVGGSDLGKNAERINTFFETLRERTNSPAN